MGIEQVYNVYSSFKNKILIENSLFIHNLLGCHLINSTLFQGLAIGPDTFENSERLT